MIVCIDTNSPVQLFGKKSRFRAIAVALMGGQIELALSTAILLECERPRAYGAGGSSLTTHESPASSGGA